MSSRNVAVAGVLGPAVVVLAMLSMGQVAAPSFGDPLPGLTADQLARFQAGKAAFAEAEDAADGLGPVFNDASCANCHGLPAVGGGSDTLETRFGRFANGVFDPLAQFGGSLIQVNGIGPFGGYNYVGEVVPRQANVVAQRRTTPLFGLGLVDAVPDARFFLIAQEEQHNNPLIAGQVSVVTDAASGQQRVGRFGWKCQQATLFTFSGDAYLNEMGITTPMFPAENCPQGNCALLEGNPANTEPNDLDNSTLQKFTDFMSFLAPPPGGAVTRDAQAGQLIFNQIGCADCHRPTMVTGPSPVAALNQVTFHPYSDFLLHDMGPLGDGIAQNQATGRLMRTAPLWGVRVMTSFLHDGRATTLRGAILAHAGQGGPTRARFANLSATNQARLIAFLNSL
jgi:CxxC motif-containing protein (DUF1111 family)